MLSIEERNKYLRYIKYERELSKSTIITRRHHLKVLYEMHGDRDITHDDVYNVLCKLKDKKYSSSYRKLFLSSIRQYFKWKNLDPLPTKGLTVTIKKKSLPKTLTPDELEKIYSIRTRSDKYSEVDDTWCISLEFLAKTGLRRSELARLRLDDFDFQKGLIRVDARKTHDERIIPIPPDMHEKLERYAERMLLKPKDYFFHSPLRDGDTQIAGSSVNRELKRRAAAVGIKRNITAHMFRHSFVTELLRQDVSVVKVQRYVGHKRLKTTLIYTHLIIKDLQEAIWKHPLVKKNSNPKIIIKRLIELIKGFGLQDDNRFKFNLSETSSGIKLEVKINH